MSDDVTLAIAKALAGTVIDLEPVCPMCAYQGAQRIDRHRVDGREWAMPCYLTWCGAHGVTAAVRDGREMPPYEQVPCDDGRPGTTSAWRVVAVRCDECGYRSAPSAFCIPTGPAVVR